MAPDEFLCERAIGARPISVGVVFEELEFAGFGVVDRLDALRPGSALAPCGDSTDKNDTAQQRLAA